MWHLISWSVYLSKSDDVAFDSARLVFRGGAVVAPDSAKRTSYGASKVALDLAERVFHILTWHFLFLLEQPKETHLFSF